MNFELAKQAHDIISQLETEGLIRLSRNEMHVTNEVLMEMDNLQIELRDDCVYPYEIFAEVGGIKVFGLADDERLNKFPQLKEQQKAMLRNRLEALEKEEETTA